MRPPYENMTNEELVRRYIDAGVRKHEATKLYYEGEDYVTPCNALVEEIGRIFGELRSRNAEPLLLPLLDHENPGVRLAVASQCLPLAPARAVAVLEAIEAAHNHVEEMSAWDTLQAWRNPLFRENVWAWNKPVVSPTAKT
jgi:HEAT repeat protein